MRLKALKSFPYRTRRMLADDTFEATGRVLPGDIFEASTRDARLLVGIGKAANIRQPAPVPPPPRAIAASIARAFPARPGGFIGETPGETIRPVAATTRRPATPRASSAPKPE
jgi:hypothetical protein